jgi:RNA polymerase sigma factor (TIGR02999 family)
VGELTILIQKAQQGDAAAQSAVFSQLYRDLKIIAHARLSGAGRQTLLDTCALINETYLRLAQAKELRPESRSQYLAYASRVMRSIIVDFVRARSAERRGGGAERVTLATAVAGSVASGEDEIIRVHEALEELAASDPRLVSVVEMRYFGGLTEQEIATALGVTDRTVRRDWHKARLLLAAAIQ